MLLYQFTLEQAEQKRRTGRKYCCACTCAGLKKKDLPQKLSIACREMKQGLKAYRALWKVSMPMVMLKRKLVFTASFVYRRLTLMPDGILLLPPSLSIRKLMMR